jgi:hypothetical protein
VLANIILKRITDLTTDAIPENINAATKFSLMVNIIIIF